MWLIFSFACIPSKSNDGIDSGSNTNDYVYTPTNTNNLEADVNCEDLEGTPHPGATTYFAGEYLINGNSITGTEEAIYVANSSWADIIGSDECRVTWAMTGEIIDFSACSTCDLHIEVNAGIDEANSNCPEELAGWESFWTGTYGIKRESDGSVTWYFGGTGAEFATGTYSDPQINFLSEGQCSWF